MFKFLAVLLAVSLSFADEYGYGQSPAGWPEPSLRANVIVPDIAAAKVSLFAWADKHQLHLVSIESGRHGLECIFSGRPERIAAIQSEVVSLGEVTDLHYYAADRKREQEDLGYEWVRKQDEVETLKKAQAATQEASSQAQILHTLQEQQNQLGVLEKRLMRLQAWDTVATAKLSLNTETSTPSVSNLAFVNMPGIEYAALFFENPSENFSATAYQGAQIKYLFTRGKSYLSVGLLHPITEPAKQDSLAATELFLFAFGQDFYSRRLGQGLRSFFNLYTGYQIGGAYLTSDANSNLIWQVTPCLGLELVKTKRMLLDARAGYFIPFDHNRELRGLLTQASFNFVF